MGLGCEGGEVTVTDDDRIELSNLSRQFLFRRKHVGLAKSISAGEAAIAMNPKLKGALKTLETRVEPKSENVFDDAFWDGLDVVVNALDNAQARKYVDGKTVLHKKPLFESGTLGTQANSGQRISQYSAVRCPTHPPCPPHLASPLIHHLSRAVALLWFYSDLFALPHSLLLRGSGSRRRAGNSQVHPPQLPLGHSALVRHTKRTLIHLTHLTCSTPLTRRPLSLCAQYRVGS